MQSKPSDNISVTKKHRWLRWGMISAITICVTILFVLGYNYLKYCHKRVNIINRIEKSYGLVYAKYESPQWIQEYYPRYLKGTVWDVSNIFISVDKIAFSGHECDDQVIRLIDYFPELQQLSLFNHSSVSNDGLVSLQNLKHLRRLSIQKAKLNSSSLIHLSRLDTLISLNLPKNEIDDGGLAHISKLHNLQELYLGGNKIRGHGLVHLSSMKSLETLSLSACPINDSDIGCIKDLKSLETLFLSRSSIGRTGLQHLGELTALKTLYLDDTNINRGISDALCPLLQLEELHLENTNIDDEELKKLKCLRSLRILHLIGTETTIQAVDELIQELKGLDVPYHEHFPSRKAQKRKRPLMIFENRR